MLGENRKQETSTAIQVTKCSKPLGNPTTCKVQNSVKN